VIVSLQVQKGKRVEQYLRTVTAEDTVAAAREAVTAMLRKPANFEVHGKKAKWQPVATKKDDLVMPGVDAIVKRAMGDGEPAEL
jgi:hypothetical protein